MRLGILAALEEEIAGVREGLGVLNATCRAGRDFWEATWNQEPVYLGRSGVGKVSAAMAMQAMLDLFPVEAVVFIGLAGALQPELEMGDLVLATENIQHDVNRPASARDWRNELHPGRVVYPSDAGLLARAEIALTTVPWPPSWRPPRIVKGRILTGDRVVARVERGRQLLEELQGVAVEMEGAAAAQVCAFNGVPFFALRCISDQADEHVTDDFQANLNHACRILTEAALALIHDLTSTSGVW